MRFIKLLCISIIAVVMIVFFFGDKETVKPTNPAVGHATTNVTNLVLNNCRNHTLSISSTMPIPVTSPLLKWRSSRLT
jgi:hypothetical protein